MAAASLAHTFRRRRAVYRIGKLLIDAVMASSTSVIASSVPGTSGCYISWLGFADNLLPITSIASGEGPISIKLHRAPGGQTGILAQKP